MCDKLHQLEINIRFTHFANPCIHFFCHKPATFEPDTIQFVYSLAVAVDEYLYRCYYRAISISIQLVNELIKPIFLKAGLQF